MDEEYPLEERWKKEERWPRKHVGVYQVGDKKGAETL